MKTVLMVCFSIIVIFGTKTLNAGNCGDVDNSGTINILDLTYLINYLYKDGSEPDCGIETGTLTDIEGNIYRTVKIGGQWWMAENLKTTHYRNGDSIPLIADSGTWEALTTGACCEYDNELTHVDIYGRLYNWFAATDNRNIAPEGWHIPSDSEWEELVEYLGGDVMIVGGKMKESDTIHWSYPNAGATDEGGFWGLPAGSRNITGFYGSLHHGAYFWSTTEFDVNTAWLRHLWYTDSEAYRRWYSKQDGLSIRCIKD